MKIALVAAALTAFAGVAHAQHNAPATYTDYPVFYVLGGAGQADLSKAPNAESAGVSFQVGGGFLLHKNWVVETTLIDFGGMEVAGKETDVTGVTFGFLGLINTGKDTAVFGRVDAVQLLVENQDTKIVPSFGVGIQHGFSHGYAARLQYQNIQYKADKAPAKLGISLISLQGIKSF